MKILVIDDSSSARKLTMKFLREMNYTDLIEAGDGLEGLEKLQANADVKVILLDRYMPRLDGLEFLLRFKDLPESKEIYVAMVTAESDQEEMVKTIMDYQPDYYITKPVTGPALMRMFADFSEKQG